MSAAIDEEAAWVQRVQAGEEEAFGLIIDRYRKPLLDFCWRLLRDAAEAEDIAQETLARAYHHLHEFKPGRAKLSTWLFLIARRQCLDLLRKRARRGEEAPPAAEPSTTRTARDEAGDAELGRAIADALAGLPEDQRTALVLAEYEGQSMADIAVVMETSQKSVESRLYRARQFLRQRLAGWRTEDGGRMTEDGGRTEGTA